MPKSKLEFLTIRFPELLRATSANTPAQWGTMNFIQMVEHMSDSISQAYGKVKHPNATNPETLERLRAFALSDKPFRPNTPNKYMPVIPEPSKNSELSKAVDELENELKAFVSYFQDNKGAIVENPFFGNFSFDEWVHLLEKHAKHHLQQFGIPA